METAAGQTGEPEVVELAVSMLYPSVDYVGGCGDQPKNKCVCVIGFNMTRFPDLLGEEEEGDSSEGTSRWWVQFFIAEGYSVLSIRDTAASGEALDFESISVDWTGIMAVHKPFKQVKMDVDRISFTSVVAPDGSPTIYCLGGVVEPKGPREEYVASRDVRIYNFITATFTCGPSMEAPRVRPVVLALDGKIFVFGGVPPTNPMISWAESLDMSTTNTNTDAHPWKLLHPPPVFLTCRGAFAVGVDDGENIFFGIQKEIKEEEEDAGSRFSSGGGAGKAILLGSTLEQIFLVYHVAEDRWIQLPDGIPIPSWSSWPVAVGHTLYWFGDYFYAYDLRSHELSRGLVRGLGSNLNDYIMGNEPEDPYKPGLHHLGADDFCLTWLDWVNVISSTFTRLHSTVIRVVMSKDDFHFVDAFVVTSTSQLLPHGFYFEHSLLLDGLVYNHTIVKEGLTSESLIPDVEAKKAVPRDDENTLSRSSRSIQGSPGPIHTRKIFVGGLASTVTETDVKLYFEQFGSITDVVVMYDHNTQRPRGFGFITYYSEDAVDKVLLKTFHELNGKKVEVKRAVPKELSSGPTRSPLGEFNYGVSRINSLLSGHTLGYSATTGGYGLRMDGRFSPIAVGRSGYGPFGSGYGVGLNFEPGLTPNFAASTNFNNTFSYGRGLNPYYMGNSNRFDNPIGYDEGNGRNTSLFSSGNRNLWGNGGLNDGTTSTNPNNYLGSKGGTIGSTFTNSGVNWGPSLISGQAGCNISGRGGNLGYGGGDSSYGLGGGGYGSNNVIGRRASSSFAGSNGRFDGAFSDFYSCRSVYGDPTWRSTNSKREGSSSFGYGLRNGASDVLARSPSGYGSGYSVTERQTNGGIDHEGVACRR